MFQPIYQWNFQVLMVQVRLFWAHLDEFYQILKFYINQGRISVNHLPGRSSISDSLNSSSIRFCAFPFSRHCFDNFEIIFIKTFDRRLNLFILGQFTNFIKFTKNSWSALDYLNSTWARIHRFWLIRNVDNPNRLLCSNESSVIKMAPLKMTPPSKSWRFRVICYISYVRTQIGPNIGYPTGTFREI